MNFSVEMDLNASRKAIWEEFDDPDDLKRWQPALQRFEPVSGEQGQVGAIMKMFYKEGGQETVMQETITARDEPESMSGLYEGGGVVNKIDMRFEALDEDRTRWIMNTNFRFSGMMRLIAPFMKGSFVKRTRVDMERVHADVVRNLPLPLTAMRPRIGEGERAKKTRKAPLRRRGGVGVG